MTSKRLESLKHVQIAAAPPISCDQFTLDTIDQSVNTKSSLLVPVLTLIVGNSYGTTDRMLGGGDAKYKRYQDVGLSEIANTNTHSKRHMLEAA